MSRMAKITNTRETKQEHKSKTIRGRIKSDYRVKNRYWMVQESGTYKDRVWRNCCPQSWDPVSIGCLGKLDILGKLDMKEGMELM